MPMTTAAATDQQAGTASDEASAAPVVAVTNNEGASRYEARDADGTLMGWLDYEIRKGNVLVTTHTVTLPAYRGQGIASKMTRQVFEDAAKTGDQIDPACWYVAEFIQRHPKYSRQVVDLGF